MSDENEKTEVQKRGPTISVSVERKINLGNYENVTVDTRLSSGTINGQPDTEQLEQKARELAQTATKAVHEEITRITDKNFDHLIQDQDNETEKKTGQTNIEQAENKNEDNESLEDIIEEVEDERRS